MMDLRRPWPFALFVVLAHVLSRFLGVAVHELLGHATAAILLGGSAYGVYVSPGSGITYVYLPESVPVAGVVALPAAWGRGRVRFGSRCRWVYPPSPPSP